MLRQLLLGGGVNVINIALHALVMTTVINVAQIAAAKQQTHPALFLTAVMTSVVLLLMATHALEVMVWSAAYAIVDVVPANGHTVYFAFVNYTTLGYGDIIPAERWQLLGPITAMNGVLLFGWSTAVMFEILRRTLERIEATVESQVT